MDICYECLKPMVKKHGDITLTRKGYGSYEVIGVIHYACEYCGSKVILPDETERVEIEGVRLHMLTALKAKGPLTPLTLKEEIKSSTGILELAAKNLLKEKLIYIDYTDANLPIISLLESDKHIPFFKIFWNRLLSIFK